MTLLIFGNPKFIIITQMIFISMIIAYIQTNITCIYMKKRYNVMMYVAFLLPTIYLYNLCAMRLVPYTYVLLLFFLIIIFDKKNNVKLTCKKVIKLLILLLLMILWRSEGLIFIIINPILIYITYINRKKKWIVMLILFFMLTRKLYNYSIKQYVSKDYDILITVNPLSAMLND